MDTERAHHCRRLGAAPLGLSPWVLSELGLEKESKVSFLGPPPRCVGLCGCCWELGVWGRSAVGQVMCKLCHGLPQGWQTFVRAELHSSGRAVPYSSRAGHWLEHCWSQHRWSALILWDPLRWISWHCLLSWTLLFGVLSIYLLWAHSHPVKFVLVVVEMPLGSSGWKNTL